MHSCSGWAIHIWFCCSRLPICWPFCFFQSSALNYQLFVLYHFSHWNFVGSAGQSNPHSFNNLLIMLQLFKIFFKVVESKFLTDLTVPILWILFNQNITTFKVSETALNQSYFFWSSFQTVQRVCRLWTTCTPACQLPAALPTSSQSQLLIHARSPLDTLEKSFPLFFSLISKLKKPAQLTISLKTFYWTYWRLLFR